MTFFYDYYFFHAFFKMYHEHIFSYFFKCQEIHIFLNLPHSHSFGYKFLIWRIPKQKNASGIGEETWGAMKYPNRWDYLPPLPVHWLGTIGSFSLSQLLTIFWPMGRYKQIKGMGFSKLRICRTFPPSKRAVLISWSK